MLELKNIVKTYKTESLSVEALKGVSLSFRENEFVSVLGPSGCGKTTLLNIIGGLDRYTSGDLVINGRSTKEYKDKDWDNYRNHSIGFVFQSYNLIPHQTVLANVELALTLSGVSKEERRKRATEVLTRVGLEDKIDAKPSQLSGGQMQRVAIARALVNDPDIILADEPTGALDSTTSVQIMEILKEISKDKLIIMVTHNPDLANEYSSRIINLFDGEVTRDSNPVEIKEEKPKPDTKNKKKRMSFFTALALSFKNLLTKKGRTILVALAGSIGIIGIALILAISNGFNSYTNKVQGDTLSTYPITINAKSVDLTQVIMSMLIGTDEADRDHELDGVYDKDSLSQIFDSVGSNLKTNDLKSFYAYINEHQEELEEFVNAIQCTYDLNVTFYSSQDGAIIQPDTDRLVVKDMIVKYAVLFFEDKTNLKVEKMENGTYSVYAGEEDVNYQFMEGYKVLDPLRLMLQRSETKRVDGLTENMVLGLSFAVLGVDSSALSGGGASMVFNDKRIFYEMIDNEALIREQYDILSGELPTSANEAVLVLDKNNEVDDYILYALNILTEVDMNDILEARVKGRKLVIKKDYTTVVGKEYKVLEESDYFRLYGEELIDIRTFNDTSSEYYAEIKEYQDNPSLLANPNNTIRITGVVRLKQNIDVGSLSTGVAYTNKYTTKMIDYHEASSAVVAGSLQHIDKQTPTSINIYVNTFKAKDDLKVFIDTYNDQAEEGGQITYTDYVGTIMSAVTTIINGITYVLIAFVALSLVVSSIMIGIITYISVIERTKEIGVLRSIGASKRDVKRVFTAESFIIGLSSGVMGILISLLLILPINIILGNLTSIKNLAYLPVGAMFALIAISVVLTFIAGLIPARAAAKKDPVVALRTE